MPTVIMFVIHSAVVQKQETETENSLSSKTQNIDVAKVSGFQFFSFEKRNCESWNFTKEDLCSHIISHSIALHYLNLLLYLKYMVVRLCLILILIVALTKVKRNKKNSHRETHFFIL